MAHRKVPHRDPAALPDDVEARHPLAEPKGGPAFRRALGLITHAEKWPEYDTLYGVAKGRAGAWVHPNSPANTRPKAGKRGDKAAPLPVGGT